MYLSELIPVVDDLQSLVGQGLSDVRQPRRDQVSLSFGSRRIVLVPRGPFARLCETPVRLKSPMKPFSFQGACRAHLGGSLRSVELVGQDREVLFTFDAGKLCLRLTGRGGGLWLIGSDGVVAAYDGPSKALPPRPAPVPQRRKPRFDDADCSWALAAHAFFHALQATQRQKQEVNTLRRSLRTERRRLTRLTGHLNRDAASAAEWPMKRRAADALSAVVWKVPDRSDRVRVADLEEEGLIHHVRLNPALRPGENLSRLYERVKRLQARATTANERLDVAQEQIAVIDAALDELEAGRLKDARSLAPTIAAPRARAPKGTDIERWVGPRGLEVWIGRSAKANRRLTFQRARGRDWWMHVRGLPGAHLILPMRGRSSPHLEWLLAAAQLVARRSNVKAGASCDVQYTQVKYVKAIPGDANARVTVAAEKVLHITVSDTLPQGWSLAI